MEKVAEVVDEKNAMFHALAQSELSQQYRAEQGY
jgi:hypothetical protein